MSQVWDVIVVGAGPAGCTVANRLRNKGHRILLLDAGSRPESGQKPAEVDRREWPFKVIGESFDWYRTYAVGGRCHQWGSWSYRFPDCVFRQGGWPFGRRTLDPAYRAVQSQMNLRRGTLSQRFSQLGKSLDLRIHPKIGARMNNDAIWTPLALPIASEARTYLPALHLSHNAGRATELTCFDRIQEEQQAFSAHCYILAASPIETARLLLCSELETLSPRIGKGFVDHMVASYTLLEPVPFEAFHDPLSISGLVERFVNIDKESQRPYPGGFTIELTGPVSLASMHLERMVPQSEEKAWRATQIHAIGECYPHEKRFVDLDPTETDFTGRPIPRIHISWSQAERQMAEDMKQACAQLADTLAVPGSKLLKFADPLTAGAGHEAGTCAMGRDPSSPCTSQGRLRALDNVWIADASTMPTSGDRHPTLTILAQAIRAADNCSQWLTKYT